MNHTAYEMAKLDADGELFTPRIVRLIQLGRVALDLRYSARNGWFGYRFTYFKWTKLNVLCLGGPWLHLTIAWRRR